MNLTDAQVDYILIAGAALTGIVILFFSFLLICMRILCREYSSGVITEVKIKKPDSLIPPAPRLRVRFDTVSGEFEGLETLAAMPDHFHVGEKVNIRYCRKKPKIFMVVENRRIRFALTVLSIEFAAILILLLLKNPIKGNTGH